MRFETSDNLIDLLVGQNLYSNPDVALRELLQNAEDACHLMAISEPSFTPEITIRYSPSQNWFEVSDNGLGMDQDTFRESFATIGASKTSSPKLQQLLAKAGTSARPIGQFGIGILSCFGVAATVEIRTLAEDSEPLSLRIHDRRKDFEELQEHRTERGTTVRLLLKHGGPMSAGDIPAAVSRYVRHATNVQIADADTGDHHPVTEQWLSDSWTESSLLDFEMIASGHLQLSAAWDNINQGLNGQIVLCNGGFLVKDNAQEILPDYTIGFRGEIDVYPGALSILMSREGFQKDADWESFCQHIALHYRTLVAEKLNEWLSDLTLAGAPPEKKRAVQRATLLILHTPLRDVVGEENLEKARTLIPRALCLMEQDYPSVENIVQTARAKPPLYAYRTDDDTSINKSLTDRGQNIQLITPIRSLALRTTLLKLNGYAVVPLEKHTYSVFYQGRDRDIHVHDHDALSELAARDGFSVVMVKDAPADHTKIGSSFDADQITKILELSHDLKIQSVDNITDAVIADYNGYILNSDNDEIRQILLAIPDAVGNPIHKGIISAYFAFSAYDFTKTRSILLELIADPHFRSKARLVTGHFFHKYLTDRIRALLTETGSSHD